MRSLATKLLVVATAFLCGIRAAFASDPVLHCGDFEFCSKYFANRGMILLPVPGAYNAGDILDLETLRVRKSLKDCLNDPSSAGSHVVTYSSDASWQYGSMEWSGNLETRISRQSVTVSVERADKMERIQGADFDIIHEDLRVSDHSAKSILTEECFSIYYPSNSTEEINLRNYVILDRIAALKGSYISVNELAFSSDVEINFTLSDLVPVASRLPWLKSILDRFDLEASANGKRLQSSQVVSRHNMLGENYSTNYVAFRPRFFSQKNYERIKEKLDSAKDDYFFLEAKQTEIGGATPTQAAFFEQNPELEISKNDYFSAVFPYGDDGKAVTWLGESYGLNSVKLTDLPTVAKEGEDPFLSEFSIEPEFLENLSFLLKVNHEKLNLGAE